MKSILSDKLIQKLQEVYDINSQILPDIKYECIDPRSCPQYCDMWLEHMNYLNSIQRFKGYEPTREMFSEALNKFNSRHEQTKLFTATENNNLIGFLQCGIIDWYAFVSDLHVKENYRGFGIGSNLFKNCLEWVNKNKRISVVELEVAGGNEKVLRFYEKNGFAIDKYTLRKEVN